MRQDWRQSEPEGAVIVTYAATLGTLPEQSGASTMCLVIGTLPFDLMQGFTQTLIGQR